MTKTEIYSQIKELVNASTLAEEVKAEINSRMDKDIEIASKKSTSTRKPSAHDIENDAIKQRILDILAEKGRITFASLVDLVGEGKERVSALVTQLADGTKAKAGLGLIKKSMEKKVRYVELAENASD